MKAQRKPIKRNPMALALQSRLFAAKVVPPRKGGKAQPKRKNNLRYAEISA